MPVVDLAAHRQRLVSECPPATLAAALRQLHEDGSVTIAETLVVPFHNPATFSSGVEIDFNKVLALLERYWDSAPKPQSIG